KIHDQKGASVIVRRGIKHRGNVLAVDRAHCADLASETRARELVLGELAIDELERDAAARCEVLPRVHRAHTADANDAIDAVSTSDDYPNEFPEIALAR